MVKRLLYGSATILGVIAAASVAGLMITVIADTAGRFFFSTPIPGANDYSRYWWMILIVFGALGIAERRNEQIEALVLEALMPTKLKVIWRYIRAALVTVTLTLMLIAMIPTAWKHRLQGEYAPGSEITIWPTRYILVVGVAVFLVVTIVKLFDDRRQILRGTFQAEGPEA
ncbi:TRAP-type C4-dicarboxylate transport system, small permease component [Paramicrobacterium humi]|uniref:TRAP-type C4-dicarboxylate transport system, small permease component n=2 Tax=Paramicrobacterium humi TaxID=640635 RepID=A0A1H4LW44_9MICO|nr:TRAP-type C4-dicarboxylate transport system, small permease component [Microbacterium humi]